MSYEGQSYYKIGRTLRLCARERDLRIGNPFSSFVAVKRSNNYEKEERLIHKLLRPYHYFGEWFELNDRQYSDVYTQCGFSEYTNEMRNENIKQERWVRPRNNYFHVFRKPKKLKDGKTVRKWYYYYYNEKGKQVQRACKGCKTRTEAEDYVRAIKEEKK
jgi:hypothetical protein